MEFFDRFFSGKKESEQNEADNENVRAEEVKADNELSAVPFLSNIAIDRANSDYIAGTAQVERKDGSAFHILWTIENAREEESGIPLVQFEIFPGEHHEKEDDATIQQNQKKIIDDLLRYAENNPQESMRIEQARIDLENTYNAPSAEKK